MAADDILHGFINLPLVWNMARQDVKLRYVRPIRICWRGKLVRATARRTL
jgi:hypothetical protein